MNKRKDHSVQFWKKKYTVTEQQLRAVAKKAKKLVSVKQKQTERNRNKVHRLLSDAGMKKQMLTTVLCSKEQELKYMENEQVIAQETIEMLEQE